MKRYYGGKLRRWEKLSRGEQADLLYDLINAFVFIKNLPESMEFITDLFTRDEVKFLSKRLRIAKMLIKDRSYREIQESLRVGYSTIAKVSAWLDEKGGGFRRILSRLPEKRRVVGWEGLSGEERSRKKHPRANWLGLTLDRFRDDAIRDEGKKLKETLNKLGSKDVVRHRVDEAYRDNQS